MPSKWIEIASPELPAAEVAADALRLRVQYVQKMLPLAAHEYEHDVEHVHQLRVACRRADATLKAFRPLLKGKSKSLQKWLRRIRRAAGPARDLDVLLARLEKNRHDDPNLASLITCLEQQRSETQEMLLQVEAKAQPEKLTRSLDRCLVFLNKQKTAVSAPSFKKFAKKSLRKSSRPVQRIAATDQPTFEQLHKLRLAGKRLRYSIEIFHGAFSPELRTKLYPLIEKLQTRLGRMNDRATAQALFQSMLQGMPTDSQSAYLARCIAEQHEAAQRLRDEFLQWWTASRVAKLESHFAALTQTQSVSPTASRLVPEPE